MTHWKKFKKKLLVIVSALALTTVSALPSQAKWEQDSNGWWYSNNSPAGYTRGWEEIDGQWYLFDQNGYMKTGWQQEGSSWYYLNDTGAMVCDTWIGNYYLLPSGVMATDQWVGNYYVLSSGLMATNQWIGEYYVGADGAWIPNYSSSSEGNYTEGTYQIGTDMPAGEYVLFNTSSYSGYFEYNSDNTGSFESIISNDNFTYNIILTAEEGNFLTLERCYAVPIESASVETNKEGMFKVGTHLDAGTYTIQAEEGQEAYVMITSDSSNTFSSIQSYQAFTGTADFMVSDGQYLWIEGGHIVN